MPFYLPEGKHELAAIDTFILQVRGHGLVVNWAAVLFMQWE